MSRKVVEIPVEVWEFSLQDAEHIAALHRETLRLMNENARLKVEVERLRASSFVTAVPVEEYEKLKAEVERLTQEYSDATNHYNKLHNDLRAEVERLRKAGDAMVCHLVCSDLPNDVCGDLMKKWNAAKEVQS